MVNVIGLGYIGLPTALMMASHGVEVVGTNHSQGKVDMLKAGKTTFKEKGLDELFQAALDGGHQVYHGVPGCRYIHRIRPDSVR